MIKKTITYTDFDGNTVNEDFYFNLTKAELIELEVPGEDGLALSDRIRIIQDTSNGKAVLAQLKEIIGAAYGVRTQDGKGFYKDPQQTRTFFHSEAWSVLFMEMLQSAEYAAQFIQSLVPSDLAEQVKNDTPKTPSDKPNQSRIEELKARQEEIRRQLEAESQAQTRNVFDDDDNGSGFSD